MAAESRLEAVRRVEEAPLAELVSVSVDDVELFVGRYSADLAIIWDSNQPVDINTLIPQLVTKEAQRLQALPPQGTVGKRTV